MPRLATKGFNPLNYPHGRQAVETCLEWGMHAIPAFVIIRYLEEPGRTQSPANWNRACDEIEELCERMMQLMGKRFRKYTQPKKGTPTPKRARRYRTMVDEI